MPTILAPLLLTLAVFGTILLMSSYPIVAYAICAGWALICAVALLAHTFRG